MYINRKNNAILFMTGKKIIKCYKNWKNVFKNEKHCMIHNAEDLKICLKKPQQFTVNKKF